MAYKVLEIKGAWICLFPLMMALTLVCLEIKEAALGKVESKSETVILAPIEGKVVSLNQINNIITPVLVTNVDDCKDVLSSIDKDELIKVIKYKV